MLQTNNITTKQSNTPINLHLASYIIANGGLTYNLLTDSHIRKGYSCAEMGQTEKIEGFNKLSVTDLRKLIEAFKRSRPALLASNNTLHLGVWVSGNVLHLECVKVYNTLSFAKHAGLNNLQESIYDLKNKKCIPVTQYKNTIS